MKNGIVSDHDAYNPNFANKNGKASNTNFRSHPKYNFVENIASQAASQNPRTATASRQVAGACWHAVANAYAPVPGTENARRPMPATSTPHSLR